MNHIHDIEYTDKARMIEVIKHYVDDNYSTESYLHFRVVEGDRIFVAVKKLTLNGWLVVEGLFFSTFEDAYQYGGQLIDAANRL